MTEQHGAPVAHCGQSFAARPCKLTRHDSSDAADTDAGVAREAQ